MADMDVAAFTAALNADQKAFFEKHVTETGTQAVEKFKTDGGWVPKTAAPEKYTLKFADQSPLDPTEDSEKIAAYCKQQNLSNEQAQALAALVEERALRLTERQTASRQQESAKWKQQVEADKELGGDKFAETSKAITRVMDRFVPKDSPFRTFLNETGFGNHPEVVRFVVAIGKAMAEDRPSILGGGGASESKSFDLRNLYPNSKMA
jgi:hypothetical protein